MKFKVKDGMQITIRKAALVQSGDEITRLASGTLFEAETIGIPTYNTWWVRVLKCEGNPKAVGYYGAVIYPNSSGEPKIFATVIEEPPAPVGDAIVKAVIYFADGTSKELFPVD